MRTCLHDLLGLDVVCDVAVAVDAALEVARAGEVARAARDERHVDARAKHGEYLLLDVAVHDRHDPLLVDLRHARHVSRATNQHLARIHAACHWPQSMHGSAACQCGSISAQPHASRARHAPAPHEARVLLQPRSGVLAHQAPEVLREVVVPHESALKRVVGLLREVRLQRVAQVVRVRDDKVLRQVEATGEQAPVAPLRGDELAARRGLGAALQQRDELHILDVIQAMACMAELRFAFDMRPR
jgi:hypothetical protein